MRLKQLRVMFVLALFMCAMAAADSQMTGVNVDSIDNNASTITIRANGPFVHNEYRPSDNLLLVDLAGVALGRLDSKLHPVNLPGLVSYRVTSYTGTQGNVVARVEIGLQPHTTVHLQDQSGALQIKVTEAVADPQTPSAPVLSRATSTSSASGVPNKSVYDAAAVVGTPTSLAKPARVEGISVVRSKDGMNVEIHAAGVSNPKALKLVAPERIVVDLPNAIAVNHFRQVPVHSPDIKTVRMSQFQANPPVTRIVVDVGSPQNYEIVNSGRMVTLKLRPPGQKAQGPASKSNTDGAVTAAATTNKETASPAASPMGKLVARDVVFVEPTYTPKAANADQSDASQKSPSERAAAAASKLGAAPPVEIPLSSTPASADMRPAAVNAAFMQVVSPGQGPSQLQPGAVQGVQGMAQQAVQQSNQGASAPPSGGTGMVSAQGTGANLPTGGRGTIGCVTGRYTGEPISVNLKDVDLKDFFRLIHEISGLNVVLDPGVAGSLTLVLDDVPWDQALSIVLNNNGLECQIEGNVLRIALPSTIKREADARRAAIEAQALAVDKTTVTRYLSYAAAKDVVPTIKQFLSQRGDIIADERTNGLIISDIPSVIPNIDRLLRELDRKTPEVEIEARVVAATRSFARDLGSQVAGSFGNRPSQVGGGLGTPATTQVIDPITGKGIPQPYTTIGTGQIPLFSNLPAVGATSGLNFFNIGSNHRLDITLTAAESRGLLKILSRPRVVTQNNIQAIVRQGVRIPVVTLAQLGGPPTVQYVDAFLRLQVRPQITVEGTIFLNVDVENTTPDFGRQVQGNPTLITQQATTQVLVTDGGTVVIGGVIQTQNSINYQQVPFLGNVPVLGNLFKRKAVSTSTQELIFFLTPKIIQT
jgi:type IV pilus assembly protein PilQ